MKVANGMHNGPHSQYVVILWKSQILIDGDIWDEVV